MLRKLHLAVILALTGFLFYACGDAKNDPEPAKASDKKITSFKFEKSNNAGLETAKLSDLTGTIDEEKRAITVEVAIPSDGNLNTVQTVVKTLKATFTLSDKATAKVGDVEQKSGETVNDFSQPVQYVITAEDGTSQNYAVTLSLKVVSSGTKSSAKEISSFKFTAAANPSFKLAKIPDVEGLIDEGDKTVNFVIPVPAPLTLELVKPYLKTLKATFTLSDKAKAKVGDVEQTSGTTANDFSADVKYTILAEDGTTKDYTVKIMLETFDGSGYKPTVLSSNALELLEEVGSAPDKDTVFLYVQGGPAPRTGTDEGEEFFERFLDQYPIYMVKQTQTINPTIYTSDLTVEQFKAESDKNAVILQRVIEHFKKAGKKVFVAGSSYGFWVMCKYLSLKPTITFDRALIGEGRFEMPELAYKGFEMGILYVFPDAVKPAKMDAATIAEWVKTFGLPKKQMINLAKFAMGLGRLRYTQLLKDVDLSNVLFTFGGKDQQVGAPSKAEIDFLKLKKANYILDPAAGHDLSPANKVKAIDFLLTGKKP